MTVHELTDNELHWVAGLLEGEGSFMLTWKGKKTNRYPAYIVQCNMTDYDVVARLSNLLQIGHLSTKRIPKQKKHKPFWSWRLTKRDEVKTLLELLLPLMGHRRAAKIREILKTEEKYPALKPHHGTRNMYERYKCRCQPCKDANSARFRKLRRIANPYMRKTGEQYLNYDI
ncbi:MAG: hypothetical protein EBU46_00850 [Nitrosomonadaceae bacterium]|nr:hypothetical protein [Nitrosomonadaceae bacterium]